MCAVSLSFVGCGDDDDTGGTPDATVTPDATPDAMGGDADTDAMVMMMGMDECTNAADTAAVERADYGDGMDQSYAAVATSCATQRFLDGIMDNPMTPENEYERSVNECLNTATMTSASASCSNCYSGNAACVASNCAIECVADPNAVGCRCCRCGLAAGKPTDCAGDFVTCSGVASTTCDGLDAAMCGM
ncbi:MAG: hypothetical protein AAGF12_24430 [Myxococcota bacterium]